MEAVKDVLEQDGLFQVRKQYVSNATIKKKRRQLKQIRVIQHEEPAVRAGEEATRSSAQDRCQRREEKPQECRSC